MKTVWKIAVTAAVSIAILMGCSGPDKVTDGNTIKVHYTGTLDDGTVFDSSRGREPLQFVVGAGQMIPGFDSAVVGMEVGEIRTFALAPEQAYGYPDDQRILMIPKTQFPEDMVLEEGMQLAGPGGMPVIVKAIGEDSVTIDANHPMAGKTLTFEVELMEIVPPAEGE